MSCTSCFLTPVEMMRGVGRLPAHPIGGGGSPDPRVSPSAMLHRARVNCYALIRPGMEFQGSSRKSSEEDWGNYERPGSLWLDAERPVGRITAERRHDGSPVS